MTENELLSLTKKTPKVELPCQGRGKLLLSNANSAVCGGGACGGKKVGFARTKNFRLGLMPYEINKQGLANT